MSSFIFHLHRTLRRLKAFMTAGGVFQPAIGFHLA
jgi:hypothetical protein